MRKLGKILHGNERGIVARAEWAPDLGARVQNRARSPIGRVSDVFGPTSAPYVAIKPAWGLKPDKIAGLAGGDVFIGRDRPRGTTRK